jgi:uncharacterized protein YkwD
MRTKMALAALALTLSAPGTALASTEPDLRLVEALNAERAAAALPALRLDPRLARASARFAERQIVTAHFGHLPRIPGEGYRRLGETLARLRGLRPRVAATVAAWMRSPTHRAILLSDAFSLIGAGMARGWVGSAPTTIWVVRVGA